LQKILVSSPDEAWHTFQQMGADFVLVFVAGQRIDNENDESLYLLNGGGDESKKANGLCVLLESL